MKDKQIKLTIGSLLHDIGKVAYRAGDHRQHSESGADFLRGVLKDFDAEILNCVKYHHAANLRTASINSNALAYITYFADNVASAVDRRESFDASDGFDRSVPLDSIFNILNGNNENAHYSQRMLDPNKGINYPSTTECTMDEGFYREVVDRIRDNLLGIELSSEYINSLLSVLEATLSYIPSSTSKRELTDISLYDHVKITAAVAECCYQYAEQNGIDNYRDFFYKDTSKALWQQQMFLLYSMDISGIQSFIYTIGSAGALRGLRARSFYLELVMEHIIDELLTALDLSRSCLIYSGGGHCYMLLPNTEQVKQIITQQQKVVNNWFMQYFDTALYIADGYAPCSAANLKNEPAGSYSELYHTISRAISAKKSHRYSAQEILTLNHRHIDGREECCVCRKTAHVNSEGRCPICAALEKLSGAILYQDYFVTVSATTSSDSLTLPGNKFLMAADKHNLLQLMDSPNYVRSYTVNDSYTGKRVATKLWVGRYTTGDTFVELAKKSDGIERIAVLRGDVDNLGSTFVSGFKATGSGRYETLSRTATLSRQLSLFFKLHLNSILADGQSKFFSNGGTRNICVVYSGGDDIFLVGA
jgi:CRISPR-associated protein Csm1